MITKCLMNVRIVATLSFFFIATSVFPQKESTIYIGTNGKLTTLKEAIYMQKIDAKSSRNSQVQTFMVIDSKWEKIYSENYKRINDSTWLINGNGEDIPKKTIRSFSRQADNTLRFSDMISEQLVRIGYAQSVMPLLLHGEVTEYYPGGKKKSISQYKNNELVSNQNWNEDGTNYIDDLFYSVDTYPTYVEGIKELNAHVTKSFKEANVDISELSGTVIIGFVVMEDGTIDGIKILRGLGSQINDIAYNAFTSLKGNWIPAKLNNKTVRYFQVFPINFIFHESQVEFAELRGALLHFQTLEK